MMTWQVINELNQDKLEIASGAEIVVETDQNSERWYQNGHIETTSIAKTVTKKSQLKTTKLRKVGKVV